MEKVKVLSCEEKTGKSGKKYFEVKLVDGRKCYGFDDIRPHVDQFIDLVVTPGEKGTSYKLPEKKKAVNTGADYVAVALESASRNINADTPEKVIETAEKYLTWLKSK